MTGKLQQLARDAGIPYVAFLRQLADSGEPIAVMAARLGLNSSRIYYEWNRCGIRKRRAKDFEFLGVTDSMKGHCDALGLNINCARMMVFRGRDPAETLAVLLAKQQAKELKQMKVAA